MVYGLVENVERTVDLNAALTYLGSFKFVGVGGVVGGNKLTGVSSSVVKKTVPIYSLGKV